MSYSHDLDASDFYNPPKCQHCDHDLVETHDSFSHEFGTEYFTEIECCPNGCDEHESIDYQKLPEYLAFKEAFRKKLDGMASNKLDFEACLKTLDDMMEEAIYSAIDILREEN